MDHELTTLVAPADGLEQLHVYLLAQGIGYEGL